MELIPPPLDSNEALPPIAAHGEIAASLLDFEATKVVRRLHQHGHQAYFVGGCVRDLLLNRKPKDFDIATSATPEEVRSIFRNCRLIGRRFRLAHVYFRGGKVVEVATFRANPTELEVDEGPPEEPEVPILLEEGEGEGEGGIEGDSEAIPSPVADVFITQDNVFGTAEQDARRRDFTINGLFYDVVEGRVIDYVRGRRDLELRQIRTIGDAEVRLREDPVRLLRAVRFAAKLDFDIESRTYAAMEGAVEDLPRCAPARLLEETFRLIRSPAASASLKLLQALGALETLLPTIFNYFRDHGVEAEKKFYAFAEALDRKVATSERLPEDALLLATLLAPIAQASPAKEIDPEQGGRPIVSEPVDRMLAELVEKARLTRRVAERCRTILLAQKTLSGQRRSRRPLIHFRRHPLFAESLQVFELSVEATGEHREALEHWQQGGAPLVKSGAAGPRRRRKPRSRKVGVEESAGVVVAEVETSVMTPIR